MSPCWSILNGYRTCCVRDDALHRRWHCDCAKYERRLLQYADGYCEDVAVAIERALDEGRITLIAE